MIPSSAGARVQGATPWPATTSLNGSPGRGLAFFLLARGMLLRVSDAATAIAFRRVVAYWRWRKSRDQRFVPPFETSTVVTFIPEEQSREVRYGTRRSC